MLTMKFYLKGWQIDILYNSYNILKIYVNYLPKENCIPYEIKENDYYVNLSYLLQYKHGLNILCSQHVIIILGSSAIKNTIFSFSVLQTANICTVCSLLQIRHVLHELQHLAI